MEAERLADDPGPDDGAAGSRRFLALFAAVGLGTLALVAVFNLVVDPTGRYGVGAVQPLVSQVRAAKLALIDRARREHVDVETVVLGSSRVLRLSPGMIAAVQPGSGPGLNLAVTSGGPADHLALLRYALDEGDLPIRRVLLAVDLETLSPAFPIDDRLLSTDELMAHLEHDVDVDLGRVLKRHGALLSFSETLSSIRALRYELLGRPPERSHVAADGTIVYDRWDRQIADGSFRLGPLVESTIKQYEGRFAGFTELAEEPQRQLVALLDLAQRRGIRVVAFLTPLHPRVVDALSESMDFQALRAKAVERLTQLTRARGARFVDLSVIETFGGDPALFYDGAHMRDPNVARMVRVLLGGGW